MRDLRRQGAAQIRLQASTAMEKRNRISRACTALQHGNTGEIEHISLKIIEQAVISQNSLIGSGQRR